MYRISDSTREHRCVLAIAAAAAAIWPGIPAQAQEDLALPPRIIEEEIRQTPAPIEAPVQSDSSAMEEIVVISDQNPWRLPDLGSSWRAQQEELQQDAGRISVDLAPLWDPDAEELPTRNPFDVTDGIRRVGFLEIFRVRFGRR
jgi:hypothetical protein